MGTMAISGWSGNACWLIGVVTQRNAANGQDDIVQGRFPRLGDFLDALREYDCAAKRRSPVIF